MGKILVIAEKPSVAGDIAKALECNERKNGYYENETYIISWAIGHLIGLKYPQEHDERYKNWNLEDLPLVFPLSESLKVLPDTASQFKVLKGLIQRSDIDLLVNAGDAGREGLLIQEWIYRMAGNTHPIKLLWLSSFTDQAVKKAFQGTLKRREDFIGLLAEAEARAEGDNLLGINYSRLLTLTKAAQGTSLSYGRCQTPLLHIACQREREIAGFHPEPYYNVEVFYAEGIKGILVTEDKERIDFKDRQDAQQLVDRLGASGKVAAYTTEEKSKKAPLLYNLAALQKTMGSRFGYTPDQTLALAQSLYEKHKILSYPRTDSQCLSTDLYNEIEDHLKCCDFGQFGAFIQKLDISSIRPEKRYFNDLKVTDHHALIPTINERMGEIYQTLSNEEKNVFDAVVRSFIAIFYPEYRYNTTEVIVENAGCFFLTKGCTIIASGYKEVLNMEPGETNDKETDDQDQQILPQMVEGDSISIESKQILDKMTKPPQRYTVSTLISVMEKYNIGTSATRAEIIKKLQNPKRQFIKLEKNKYYVTDFGMKYIDIIPEELKDPNLTNRFEEQLQKVNRGELSKQAFLEQLQEDLQKNISQFSQNSEAQGSLTFNRASLGKCPKCGKEVYANAKAYGCSGYKEGCDFVIWKKIREKSIPEAAAKQLLMKGRTSKMKGFKGKNGKPFEAALVLKPDKTVGFLF